MPNGRTDAFLAILERLPVSVVIADSETGGILWVNARNMQLAGATDPAQIVGRNLLEFLPTAEHGIALRDVERVARGESPPPVVYHLKRLDGGAAAVQIASTPMTFRDRPAMLSIVTDVTVREDALAALAESEERYRQLVETSPDGIVVAVEGQMVYANPTLCRALGLECPTELAGRSIYDFIDPQFHRAVREGSKDIYMKRARKSAGEVVLLRADGGRIRARAVSTLVRWEGERATQTLIRDIESAAEENPV